jgi:putative transcriptional regulator
MGNTHTGMQSLVNQFLIAMPSLDDSYFGRTVTYICEHDDDGAMGLVVNKNTDITLTKLLDEIKIGCDGKPSLDDKHVLSGGPVQPDRGFVLHNGSKQWSSSLKLKDDIIVTTSKDILEQLGSESGPQEYILTLGYAGWSAGQLEQEIADNSWLTIDADPALIFNTPVEKRWEKAVQMLGIDIAQLTSFVGHA